MEPHDAAGDEKIWNLSFPTGERQRHRIWRIDMSHTFHPPTFLLERWL